MNNLSQYHQPNNTNDLKIINNNYKTTAETSAAATATATGYGSADDVVHRPSAPGRDRKRGLFLITSNSYHISYTGFGSN